MNVSLRCSNEVTSIGTGFHADGKDYLSERDAIISFVEGLWANEACSGQAFAKWAAVCKTDCIRSGLV